MSKVVFKGVRELGPTCSPSWDHLIIYEERGRFKEVHVLTGNEKNPYRIKRVRYLETLRRKGFKVMEG